MSAWLAARGLPYRDSAEKAYSTDANLWGATHEAKLLELLDNGMDLVDPIMGVAHWDPAVASRARRGSRPVRSRLAGRHQRRGVRRPCGAGRWRPTPSAGATAWA